MIRRFIIPVAIAFAVLASATAALAQDASPTPAQIEEAKKAFAEGKAFHDAGKLLEAIEKFKKSYELSKNPLLLYNIGLTMDEAGMADLALLYYRKFLAEAPADAAQRATVTERSKAIEKKLNLSSTGTDPEPTKPDPGPKKPLVIKPVGTYSASDFQHQIAELAPPGKPYDVTAFVPEDSGFKVTLYYRTAGEGKYTPREMQWRYKELVGRIPAPKMIGDSVQYYIEVEDQAGTTVTRSGKSTSPNLITIEAGAPERFYPDITDEGDVKLSASEVRRRDEEDDPLNKTRRIEKDPEIEVQPEVTGAPGNGFRDVGSTKFTYAKWGTTGAAALLLGASVATFVLAGNQASNLEEDSKLCGSPPCREFDNISADYEAYGKRYQTMSNVTFGIGLAVTAVAGYFWYKELTAKKRGELTVGKNSAPSPETSWAVTPALGEGYAGAAAAVRF